MNDKYNNQQDHLKYLNHIVDSFYDAVEESNETYSELIYGFTENELKGACIELLEYTKTLLKEEPDLPNSNEIQTRIGDLSYLLSTLVGEDKESSIKRLKTQ